METHKASWCRRLLAAAATALLLVPLLGVSPAAATTGTWWLTQSTTLHADYYGNIVIETDDVTLDCAGHTIHGPGATDMVAGVFIDGASGVTVKRCVITGFTAPSFISTSGIHAADSSAVTISDNTVTGNAGQGIVLERNVGGVVRGNTAARNGANGIHTAYSNGVTVSGNTVTGNAEHGIHIYTTVGGRVVGNTSRSNGSPSLGGGGIVISASTKILVRGNTAIGNTIAAGIALGIGTTASTVVGNTSDRNGQGFEVSDSNANTLTGNRATGNTYNGFVLWYGVTGNVLAQNTANKNHDGGFVLVGANANKLTLNTANGNVSYGFVVVEGASNNTISFNTAHRNAVLDAVEDGSSGTGNVWLRNCFGTTSGI